MSGKKAAGGKLRLKRGSSMLKPPVEMVCPITRDVMKDPVMVVASGHTYERSAIEKWFALGNRVGPE